jgi:hypothetical protein
MSIARADDIASAPGPSRLALARAVAVRPKRLPWTLVLGALSLVLAAASLLLPSTPSYDPWAWIIWGREIIHLDLVTSGGPTWKPLPMIFTTLFAPFGSAAPALWLLVARAGGIMAIFLTFRLAFRLARAATGAHGFPPKSKAGLSTSVIDTVPALLAGTIAAASIFALASYVYDISLGYSEGLLVSLTLLAILRYLDGAPIQAFVLGFGASLDRPEVWPFLGLYAVHLWRREPRARKLIVLLFALIPPLWLLPDLLGSGSLIRGVKYAIYPRGPATAHCPFCAEITTNAWPLVTPPVRIGILLLLAPLVASFAGVIGKRRRRVGHTGTGFLRSYRRILVLFVIGVAFLLEDALLTEAGSSGNTRYLFLAVSILIVVAAVGWAGVVSWLGHVLLRFTNPLVGVLSAVVLSVSAFVAISPGWGSGYSGFSSLTFSELRYQAQLRRELPDAVRDAGGARYLIACGIIQTNPANAALLAWTLGVRIKTLETTLGSPYGDVLIQTRDAATDPLEPNIPSDGRYHLVASVPTVQIFSDCN